MNNFYALANCLKIIDDRKGNFKSAVLKNNMNKSIPGSDFKRAYSIIIKTYKNLHKIKEFVEEVLSKKKISVNNIHLFAVQVNEYFFGKLKQSKAGGKIKRIIKDHE